jgi:hypothetical protein
MSPVHRLSRFYWTIAAAAALVGCVTMNDATPAPQRAAVDYVTVYCAPKAGTDAYTLAAPREYASCQSGDTALTADEFEKRQPAGAKLAAFLDSRGQNIAPIKEWTRASVAGDGSVFTFRNWQMGDPLDREFSGYLIGQPRPGRPHCDVDIKADLISCEDQSIVRRSPSGAPQAYLGDIPVDSLTYYFLINRKLYGFFLSFPTPAFDRVSSELRFRYGTPHRTGTDVVRNRAASPFNVKVEVWDTPHGPMTLRSRSEAVNTGTLQLFDEAAKGWQPSMPRRVF